MCGSHECEDVHGVQKRMSDNKELELQESVSLILVLETNLGSSERASALKHEPSFQPLHCAYSCLSSTIFFCLSWPPLLVSSSLQTVLSSAFILIHFILLPSLLSPLFSSFKDTVVLET